MRAVDTNVLVRLIVRDDEHQAAAADAFIRAGAWVSHLTLAEATWVLDAVYGLNSDQVATIVEMLLAHEHLTIQEESVVASALETFRRRPGIGFSDCLILESGRKAGHHPLGTLDRALARVPGAQLVKA